MKITVDACVFNSSDVRKNVELKINSKFTNNSKLKTQNLIAYPPLINAHDHLISNWFPKAGIGKKYKNVNGWIEDMKISDSFQERNKVWINDGSFDLTEKRAELIIKLGIYKNLFSGCSIVQDHIPNQKPAYYQNNHITIMKNYSQFHSMQLGNWWGGDDAITEWKRTAGKYPFVIHSAEGIDESAQECFKSLEEIDLLKPNTLLIHGIAITQDELEKCADLGISICWCPASNLYLIGETLDVISCLEAGVNVALGTDSAMSGSINLLSEMKFAHKTIPEIPAIELYKMVTEKAAKALMLDKTNSQLDEINSDLLLLTKKCDDPFENLLQCDMNDIQLFIHQEIPLYGNKKFLANFEIIPEDYYFYGENRFVIGHPEKLTEKINAILGYQKDFPFLPF